MTDNTRYLTNIIFIKTLFILKLKQKAKRLLGLLKEITHTEYITSILKVSMKNKIITTVTKVKVQIYGSSQRSLA